MKVTSPAIVNAHLILSLIDDTVAEDTRAQNRPTQMVLGDQSLSPQLEQQLITMRSGDRKQFTLKPEHAFGPKDLNFVHILDRSQFGETIEVEIGTIVNFVDGMDQQVPGVIQEINGDRIKVDFNHPLAGQTIIFDVEILDVTPL